MQKIKYIREDYATRPWIFKLRCAEFGVRPECDLFASKDNRMCDKFFSAAEDALAQIPWPAATLWCNPPWSLWPAVSLTIALFPCFVVSILPGWNCDWVKRLLHLSIKRIYSETGIRFFEIDRKACPGIRWPVWALLVKSTGSFDESRLNEPVTRLKNFRVVPAWAATPAQRRRKRRLQVTKFWNEQKIPEQQ